MKTEITLPIDCQAPALPYFVKHRPSGKIVMVQEINFDNLVAKGTVVNETGSFDFGYFGKGWSILTDPNNWEILPNGTTVVLTQEI